MGGRGLVGVRRGGGACLLQVVGQVLHGGELVERRYDPLGVERLRRPQRAPPADALEGAAARRHVGAAVAERGAEGAHELGLGTQRVLHKLRVERRGRDRHVLPRQPAAPSWLLEGRGPRLPAQAAGLAKGRRGRRHRLTAHVHLRGESVRDGAAGGWRVGWMGPWARLCRVLYCLCLLPVHGFSTASRCSVVSPCTGRNRAALRRSSEPLHA